MKKSLLVSCAAIVAGVVSANAAVYSDWNNFDSASHTINSTSGAVASTITTPSGYATTTSSTLNLSTATSTNSFILTPGDTTLSLANTSTFALATTFTLNNSADTAVETIFTASTNNPYYGLLGLSFNTSSGTFTAASFGNTTTFAISGWGSTVATNSTITAFYYNTGGIASVAYQINGGSLLEQSGSTLSSQFTSQHITSISMGSQTLNTPSSGYATYSTTNFPNTGSNITVSDFQIQTGAISAISAVPEPSTYGLIGAGALAAAAFVRRRRKVA